MVVNRQIRWTLAALLMMAGASANAQDCVSSLQSVSQQTVTPNYAAGPLAQGGSIIGVAKNGAESSHAIAFATYDLELNQRSPDRVVVPGSYDGALSLLWNGAEFGLFFRTPGAQLALQRVSADGSPVGSAMLVGANHGGWIDSQFAFTWDGTHGLYLIVVSIPQGSDRGLRLVGITPEGTVRIDQLVSFVFARVAAPAIAVRGDGTIGIVWGYADTASAISLAFLTIDPQNNYGATAVFATDANAPRIATDGSQFAVVWSAPKSGGGTELHWTRRDGTGAIVAAEKTLLSGKGADVSPVWLLWNGARGEWALSYLDAVLGLRLFPPELRLRRFSADGSLVGDSLFSPDTTKNLLVTPYPFFWSGRRYVTSLERFFSRAEGSESYLAGHCPLTAAIVVSNPYPAPNTAVAFDALVTGGVPSLSYFWDFGDHNGTANVKSPQHTFVFAGDYTVTLTITDANQSVSRSTYVIHAGGTAPPPPCTQPPSIVTPIADRRVALPGDVVTFSSPMNANASYSYSWNFGDLTFAGGAVVTHRFTAPGTYIVIMGLTPVGSTSACPVLTGGSVEVRIVAAGRRRSSH